MDSGLKSKADNKPNCNGTKARFMDNALQYAGTARFQVGVTQMVGSEK